LTCLESRLAIRPRKSMIPVNKSTKLMLTIELNLALKTLVALIVFCLFMSAVSPKLAQKCEKYHKYTMETRVFYNLFQINSPKSVAVVALVTFTVRN
jgi:hypothetical protein